MLLVIFILTLITIVLWTSLSTFFAFTRTTLPPEVSRNLRPITPVIDREMLQQVSSRTQYSQEQLSSFTLSRITDETEQESLISPSSQQSTQSADLTFPLQTSNNTPSVPTPLETTPFPTTPATEATPAGEFTTEQ
mgnify:CR=1 FL=1